MALSPAVKDYWLLRLACSVEPWARAQPIASWAQLADSNPHLRVDAHAMRKRFYELVEAFQPHAPLADDATDLDKRSRIKLREVCDKLKAFHERNDQKRRGVLCDYGRAVAELERSQRQGVIRRTGAANRESETGSEDEELNALLRPETPLELPLPDSDRDESPSPQKKRPATLKRRREAFWELQTKLLRMQMRVDTRQAQLYTTLLTKQASPHTTPTERKALERQLQLLDNQVALQRDQAQLQVAQLALELERTANAPT